MDLSAAIPEELFAERFTNVRKNVIADTPETFLRECKKHIASAGLFVWDEMVHRNLVKNPTKIGPYINFPSEGLIDVIDAELGEPSIREVYAVEYFNDVVPDKPFAEVVLAHTWPNDINIVDVVLADNTRPIPQSDPTYQYRDYKGLGAFDALMAGVTAVAKVKGANRISLLVAYPTLYQTFAKRGFQVGPSEMAKMAYRNAGRGYSMIKKLR